MPTTEASTKEAEETNNVKRVKQPHGGTGNKSTEIERERRRRVDMENIRTREDQYRREANDKPGRPRGERSKPRKPKRTRKPLRN